eukprot:917635-Amphidinium_carterae.1
MAFLGVHQGWFQGGKSASVLLKPLRPKSSEGNSADAKPSMQETVEKENLSRDKMANGLHLAATILADADIQTDARIVGYLTKPHHALHSHWAHFLSSTGAGLDLALSLASGKDSLKLIHDLSQRLGDPEGLKKCGLLVDLTGKTWKSEKLDGGAALAQSSLLERMGNLMWTLVSEEVAYMSMWRSTYPYRLASGLKGTEAMRQEEASRLKRLELAWTSVKENKQGFWQKIQTRTSLHWVVNCELFELLLEDGWLWTERLTCHVRRMFANMGSTIVTERAFQCMWDHERYSSRRELSACSLWRKPVTDGLLSRRHTYREVDPSIVSHDELVGQDLPKTFFRPSFKDSSDSFADLPGKGKTSDWEKLAAPQMAELGTNTDFMLGCYENDEMSRASACWKSSLLQAGMVVRKKVREKWAFCVHSSLCIAYFWEAEMERVGKVKCWKLAKISNEVFWGEPVLDVEEWEVMQTSVRSPLELQIMNRFTAQPQLPVLPVVEQGPPHTLLTWAARSAFRGCTKAYLKRLDAEEIGSISNETELGDIVFVMMQSVLKLDDAAIIELMKKRCLTPNLDEREQILASEEAEEAMSVDGKDELKKLRVNVERAEETPRSRRSLNWFGRPTMTSQFPKPRNICHQERSSGQTTVACASRSFSMAAVVREAGTSTAMLRHYSCVCSGLGLSTLRSQDNLAECKVCLSRRRRTTLMLM